MITSAVLGIVLVLTSGPAGATAATQRDAARNYLQPSLVLTVQPAATANHRISPPLGGHAIGFGIGAGHFITHTLAVESQLLYAGSVATQQRFSYFWYQDYTGESRDILLNGLLRWKPASLRWLELVGGGGLAIVRSGQRDIVETRVVPPSTTVLPDSFTTYYRQNFTWGVEAALTAGAKTAIVPSFRIRWRPVFENDAYQGVGVWAVQFGLGIREMF